MVDWQLVATILGALAAGLFGQDWLRRGLRSRHLGRPHVQVSIVRERNEAWRVKCVVSAPEGKPPILLETLKGKVEPQFQGAQFEQVPVLLYVGPEPKRVDCEEFTYLVEHLPLPPKGRLHKLTVHLVTKNQTVTKVVHVTHDGGRRDQENWLRSRIAGWRARRWTKAHRL